MLIGETIGMALVTFFAIVRYFEWYDLIQHGDVIWMMWMVFLTGSLSTMALIMYMIKINHHSTRRRKEDHD